MKYQAVFIEWIDSTMKMQIWVSTEKLIDETKNPSSKFRTISYLVNENKLEYILASSIHYENGEIVGFGQIFTIPKGCVTKMKKIKINP